MTPLQTGRPARAAAVLALALALSAVGTAAPASAATGLSRTSDATWQTNGGVADVLTVGSTTYLAGRFTAVRPSGAAAGTNEVPRLRLAAVDAANGSLLPWRPTTDGPVESIAVSADGSTIFLGGSFTTVNGQPRKNVAAVSAATGALTSFRADTTGAVKALVATGDRLYLGGAFTSVNGTARIRLAAVNFGSGLVSGTWRPNTNATVLALALSPDGSTVYAGGLFTSVSGDATRKRLVKLSASTGALQPWASYPGYPIMSIVVTGSSVFVGGDGSGGHAGSYSLTGQRGWVLQTDGGVNAVAVRDGVLYVGGHFDNVCKGDTAGATTGFTCPENKAARKKIVAVDASDGALDPWDPGANSTIGVTALDTEGTVLRVGGLFTKLGRVPGGNVLRAQQGYGSFR